MMRKLKFRAWFEDDEKIVKDSDLSIFYCGELGGFNLSYDNSNPDEDGFCINTCDFVLMQFSGVMDKNGKEIYEGDIVKGKRYFNGIEKRLVGEVFFSYGSFEVKGIGKYEGITSDLDGCFEVIGNIYESGEFSE